MTKHLLYLQLRRSLLEQQMQCEMDQHIALSGLALQSEFGDYSDQVRQPNFKEITLVQTNNN
jgi:hypothetical protein